MMTGNLFYSDFVSIFQLEKNDRRFLWCCRGSCHYKMPYFGFIWLKAKREPSDSDLMWCNDCSHNFELYAKDRMTEWDCLTIFNNFVIANKIQIKSNQICANDFNDAGSFVILPSNEINDDQYVNFDVATNSFISLEEFFPHLYADSEENCTVCTICFHSVAKENVIEHLNSCTGLTFSITQPDLPILMINKPNEL